VTEACSLACRFCGYSREVVRPRRTIDIESACQFARVLSEFQRQSGTRVLVSWLGGEPLSWPGLPRLANSFHLDFGLQLSVTTNGLPLSSAAVRRSVLADYEQLTISIDGPADFHDAVRGMHGLYCRVKNSVSQLLRERRDSPLLLRVNTVLMRDNIERFDEFAVETANWGFQELTFNQLGGNERPEFHAEHRLLPDQLDRFRAELPTIRERAAKMGLRILGTERYLHRLACTAAGVPIAIADCLPGTRFLFINEQGLVCPCSFTCDTYGVPLREIDSIESLRELPRRFAALRRRQQLDVCRDCHATHVFDKFTPESSAKWTDHDRQVFPTGIGSAHQAAGVIGTPRV
jgi:MoaA/NifB/PqqE/SkfB family radical SAM enzyme